MKDPETIVREEVRAWLRGEASEATVARDIIAILDAKPRHEARVFAARLSDAALEYLVATELPTAPVAEEPAVAEPEWDDESPVPDDDDDPGPAGPVLDPRPTDPSPAAPAAPVPEPDPVPVDAVAEPAEDAA